jgi:hypothetical protein
VALLALAAPVLAPTAVNQPNNNSPSNNSANVLRNKLNNSVSALPFNNNNPSLYNPFNLCNNPTHANSLSRNAHQLKQAVALRHNNNNPSLLLLSQLSRSRLELKCNVHVLRRSKS